MEKSETIIRKIKILKDEVRRLEDAIKEQYVELGRATFSEMEDGTLPSLPGLESGGDKKELVQKRAPHGQVLSAVENYLKYSDLIGPVSMGEISKAMEERLGRTVPRSSLYQAVKTLVKAGKVADIFSENKTMWVWREE